jgi:hypothetical protein
MHCPTANGDEDSDEDEDGGVRMTVKTGQEGADKGENDGTPQAKRGRCRRKQAGVIAEIGQIFLACVADLPGESVVRRRFADLH